MSHKKVNKDIKKCANCGKEMDMNDPGQFQTIMHHQMHRYVCSRKCMYDFYK